MASNTEPAIQDDFKYLKESATRNSQIKAVERIEERFSRYVPKSWLEDEQRDHKQTKENLAKLEGVNDTLMIAATQRQEYATKLEDEVLRLRGGLKEIIDNPGLARRRATELYEDGISMHEIQTRRVGTA